MLAEPTLIRKRSQLDKEAWVYGAAGAGRSRRLLRHLLPAAGGYITMQATLLLPAFILAEATLSFELGHI